MKSSPLYRLQQCAQVAFRTALLLCVVWVMCIEAQAQLSNPQFTTDTIATSTPLMRPVVEPADSLVSSFTATIDTLSATAFVVDSTFITTDSLATLPQENSFDPDGMRAVWMSALFPGLGQIYNRRYWKLPIVVGGFAGLIYATTWNGRMLADYQQAYLDIMDTDPTTNSYMNFFPPYYTEDNLDKSWLTNVLKTRKDSYRHYRDYCIVGMVALYLVCIIDAYVDAELYHFDMSPDLSMDVKPALIPITVTQRPAVGLQCAITF